MLAALTGSTNPPSERGLRIAASALLASDLPRKIRSSVFSGLLILSEQNN